MLENESETDMRVENAVQILLVNWQTFLFNFGFSLFFSSIFCFFFLTLELKFGSFQVIFFFANLVWGISHLEILRFCLDFFHVFIWLFFFLSVIFLLFVFGWYCLVLVNFEFRIRVRQIRLVISI